MNASKLIPGISDYPELALQMEQRLDRLGAEKCSSCAKSSLIREFRRKLQDRVERDRMAKGGFNNQSR